MFVFKSEAKLLVKVLKLFCVKSEDKFSFFANKLSIFKRFSNKGKIFLFCKVGFWITSFLSWVNNSFVCKFILSFVCKFWLFTLFSTFDSSKAPLLINSFNWFVSVHKFCVWDVFKELLNENSNVKIKKKNPTELFYEILQAEDDNQITYPSESKILDSINEFDKE